MKNHEMRLAMKQIQTSRTTQVQPFAGANCPAFSRLFSRVGFLCTLSAITACSSLAQTQTATSTTLVTTSNAVATTALDPAASQNLAPAPRPYTQAELEQMLAPIALYPDALLSQLLMAATYPLDVVEAARWVRSHPELQGQQAVQALEADTAQEWDPSVMSLVAFPQLLGRMEENLSWTRRLGEAFIYQQAEVMDSVQRLRLRAMEEGNLHSSEQIKVVSQGQTIIIEQANPQVIYVPYYNPNFIYGSWWWRSYPPMYWAPWPGYVSLSYSAPYTGSGLVWSAGITIGTGFFFGIFDWRQHRVFVRPTPVYVRSPRYDPRHYRPHTSPRLGSVLIWRHQPAPHRVAAPRHGTRSVAPNFAPRPGQNVRPGAPAARGSAARPARPSQSPQASQSSRPSGASQQLAPDTASNNNPSRRPFMLPANSNHNEGTRPAVTERDTHDTRGEHAARGERSHQDSRGPRPGARSTPAAGPRPAAAAPAPSSAPASLPTPALAPAAAPVTPPTHPGAEGRTNIPRSEPGNWRSSNRANTTPTRSFEGGRSFEGPRSNTRSGARSNDSHSRR